MCTQFCGSCEGLGEVARVSTERRWVSVKSLSRLLDISPKTIWDWIYKSRKQQLFDPIPYYKVGSLLRFDLTDILTWLERRKVRSVAPSTFQVRSGPDSSSRTLPGGRGRSL